MRSLIVHPCPAYALFTARCPKSTLLLRGFNISFVLYVVLLRFLQVSRYRLRHRKQRE